MVRFNKTNVSACTFWGDMCCVNRLSGGIWLKGFGIFNVASKDLEYSPIRGSLVARGAGKKPADPAPVSTGEALAAVFGSYTFTLDAGIIDQLRAFNEGFDLSGLAYKGFNREALIAFIGKSEMPLYIVYLLLGLVSLRNPRAFMGLGSNKKPFMDGELGDLISLAFEISSVKGLQAFVDKHKIKLSSPGSLCIQDILAHQLYSIGAYTGPIMCQEKFSSNPESFLAEYRFGCPTAGALPRMYPFLSYWIQAISPGHPAPQMQVVQVLRSLFSSGDPALDFGCFGYSSMPLLPAKSLAAQLISLTVSIVLSILYESGTRNKMPLVTPCLNFWQLGQGLGEDVFGEPIWQVELVNPRHAYYHLDGRSLNLILNWDFTGNRNLVRVLPPCDIEFANLVFYVTHETLGLKHFTSEQLKALYLPAPVAPTPTAATT